MQTMVTSHILSSIEKPVSNDIELIWFAICRTGIRVLKHECPIIRAVTDPHFTTIRIVTCSEHHLVIDNS